ncbi:unnamed protein product [Paramecium sonneborni]|uniref:Uncharacterized protein n=1 Tax=Paramecium sonneborni TaxID=65129 RepID=A0A8S1QUQ9_9CILI|nr:unnamed protein product [Paramecium sonneborni]
MKSKSQMRSNICSYKLQSTQGDIKQRWLNSYDNKGVFERLNVGILQMIHTKILSLQFNFQFQY